MGKFGVLVPNIGDVKDNTKVQLTQQEQCLIDAIIKLYNERQLYDYYCTEGLKRAEEFSMSNIVKEWERIIEEKK